MCGIAGYLGGGDRGLLEKMLSRLSHRGPDDAGIFSGADAAIGMRRLKIVDLETGWQPKANQDRTVALVFNGEIYNYRQLRSDMADGGAGDFAFCEAQILLESYLRYGSDFATRLRGMFAIAVLDLRGKPTLHLYRDRLGIKPLYYTRTSRGIYFASELKALLHVPGFTREPRLEGIGEYLRFRYVTGDESLIKGIHRLPPATHLYVNDELSTSTYWTPPMGTQYADDVEWEDRLHEKLRETMRLHMRSDMPLGLFLSGGLDSSLLAAMAMEEAQRPLDTFSIGFGDNSDELKEAGAIARQLGANHHDILCSEKDLPLLPKVVYHLDEPIGDAIIVPMYLLARESRKYVTVVLSGEGADESFGGYFYHKVIYQLFKWFGALPRTAIWGISRAVALLPSSAMSRFFNYPAALGKQGKERVLLLLECVATGTMREAYEMAITLFTPQEIARMVSFVPQVLHDVPAIRDFTELLDLQRKAWLPHNILMKLDKITMACSLEGRVPFMDHELYELAVTMPVSAKVRGWRDKVVLRSIARQHGLSLPARSRKRPFYIPVERFCRSREFRRLMEATLLSGRMEKRGIIRPRYAETLAKQMAEGEFLLNKQIVSLMVLELWFQTYVDNDGVEQYV